MSEKDRLERAAESGEPFLMETDYVDDPEKPGMVLGRRQSRAVSAGCWKRDTTTRSGALMSRHPAPCVRIDTESTLNRDT